MSGLYDLIVVGGGIGGSTLAKCMAESGARVLVIEREREFKDRVRGELITPWGVAEAERLGIGELLRRNGAHEIPWVNFYSGCVLAAHRDVVATTPHGQPCLAFYHPAMQQSLIDAAVRAGAAVRQGTAVREVRTGATPSVVVGGNGAAEEIGARLVVGADGRSSAVRACAGFEFHRDAAGMMVAGVLLENTPAPEDTGQIITDSILGQVTVLFPQGGGRARTYLCYHADTQPRYQGSADFARYLEGCQRAGANPGFYDGAKAAGPLATFDGTEKWVEYPYRDGVALVGDAAACSDPTWGQGLSLTLRDARVLRDQLLATDDWNAAGHAYAAEHGRYAGATHLANGWFTELYLATGEAADARRRRALPLVAEDPSREPDTLFSGPDLPLNEEVRKRYFAES